MATDREDVHCFLQDMARNSRPQSNTLSLDLKPGAEQSKATQVTSAQGSSVGMMDTAPDSPAYRGGIDINFLRTHEV